MARVSARVVTLTAILISSWQAAEATAPARLDATEVLALSEAAIGRSLRDQTLTEADGSTFQLADLRGRPLVVSLVYTSCNSVCPMTTQNLRSAVARARTALGDDAFRVITIGFDARNDTPQRMASFAKDQNIDGDRDWRVASGDASGIEAILADLGFSYAAVAGGFDHITQTTILDSEGRVYRHVYGDAFPIQVFVAPLKALTFGTAVRSFSLADLADRVRFLCTVYDPLTGRYRTDFAIAFGISTGALSLMITGLLIVRMWRANGRLQKRRAGS